jgi:hypothetical protein
MAVRNQAEAALGRLVNPMQYRMRDDEVAKGLGGREGQKATERRVVVASNFAVGQHAHAVDSNSRA